MSLNVDALRSSFELVMERQPDFTERFYEILFSRYPQVLPLFGRNSGEAQRQMLTETLVAVVDHLEDSPWLIENLKTLGVRHLEYGVKEEMYAWVGDALLSTLSEVAGEDWTPAVHEAWVGAYSAITELMGLRSGIVKAA